VTLSADPEVRSLLETAPRIGGVPVLLNLPAFAIVAALTGLLLLGVRESTRANNVMVVIKLAVLALFVGIGVFHLDPANFEPFAPNGWRGIHQGAAVVFFAYIGFDALSVAAEETRDPQRNLPIGILAGLAVCTVIYVVVGIVATGLVPYSELRAADPLARALDIAGFPTAGWIVSFGAVVSITAVLLVFQYGQPRILFAMARDGLLPSWASRLSERRRVPYVTTIASGVLVGVGSLFADENEIYDLSNIGTLWAFALVCLGVLVLRYLEPDRPRPFRVPFVWPVSLVGAGACVYTMMGLPGTAWERFGIWLVIGVIIYALYGYRHSRVRNAANGAA
jgi:APA family basic amino acid/polyamine antiporter